MEPSDTPGGSAVGASSWPCSFASWDTPSRYAKSVVDWPPAKGSCDKGAVKLHLLLDHDGYLPAFAVITERRTRTTGWWRTPLVRRNWPHQTSRRRDQSPWASKLSRGFLKRNFRFFLVPT